MALNIRNKEAERLAADVARLTGETKTQAVIEALRARLRGLTRQPQQQRLLDDLDELALHCAALPVLDDRAADDIIDYDETGLAR